MTEDYYSLKVKFLDNILDIRTQTWALSIYRNYVEPNGDYEGMFTGFSFQWGKRVPFKNIRHFRWERKFPVFGNQEHAQ